MRKQRCTWVTRQKRRYRKGSVGSYAIYLPGSIILIDNYIIVKNISKLN